jgi:hypothetical protein
METVNRRLGQEEGRDGAAQALDDPAVHFRLYKYY